MEQFNGSVMSAVDDACSIAEELRDELQEWYDNLPENFQNGSKGEALQEAIYNLEEFIDGKDEPVEAAVGEIKVSFEYPALARRASRADRLEPAIDMLDKARDAVEEYRDVLEEERDAFEKACEAKNPGKAYPDFEKQAELDCAEEYADQFDAWMEALENVVFPGMY